MIQHLTTRRVAKEDGESIYMFDAHAERWVWVGDVQEVEHVRYLQSIGLAGQRNKFPERER